MKGFMPNVRAVVVIVESQGGHGHWEPWSSRESSPRHYMELYCLLAGLQGLGITMNWR